MQTCSIDATNETFVPGNRMSVIKLATQDAANPTNASAGKRRGYASSAAYASSPLASITRNRQSRKKTLVHDARHEYRAKSPNPSASVEQKKRGDATGKTDDPTNGCASGGRSKIVKKIINTVKKKVLTWIADISVRALISKERCRNV